MKLYRIIADQFCNTREAFFHPEESLYQLGYMAATQHAGYFPHIDPLDRGYNPLYDEGGEGMFFFTNPWDAVFCSDCLNGAKSVIRIHEYEIPEEIIEKSIQGLGAGYYGERFNEIKIPFSVMETMDGYIDTLSPELEKQVKDMNHKLYLQSEKIYRKTGMEKTANVILNFLSNTDFYSKFQQNCIDAFIFAVKGLYVTGNILEINKVFDRSKGGWQPIDYVSAIENSNGILTYENIPKQLIEFFEERQHSSEYVKLLEAIELNKRKKLELRLG